MKKDIQPNYGKCEIKCVCGNVIETGSVKSEIKFQLQHRVKFLISLINGIVLPSHFLSLKKFDTKSNNIIKSQESRESEPVYFHKELEHINLIQKLKMKSKDKYYNLILEQLGNKDYQENTLQFLKLLLHR